MKKTFLFFALLILGINMTFAQANKGTCIIGYTGSLPTPTISMETTDLLNHKIASAFANGYKSVKISSGTYKIDASIEFPFGNNSIEGSGSSTIISSANSTQPIFSISTQHNTLRNLSILTKDGSIEAIAGIQINHAGQRNIIENIYFGDTSITSSNPQILINLPTGEADHNAFSSIYMTKCEQGIKVVGAGVFNHNTFNNIHFDEFTTAIDFSTAANNSTNMEGNVFSNIFAKASTTTQCLIKDIRGSNNTFQNINFNNWPSSGTTVIGVSSLSNRTVIENVKGTFVSEPHTNTIINDLGIATLLASNQNNSDSNSVDYISNNARNILFKSAVSVINTTNGVYVPTIFNIENFDKIQLKPKNTIFSSQGSTSDTQIVPNHVLTTLDANGSVGWRPAPTSQITSISNNLSGTNLTTTINGTITSTGVDLSGIASPQLSSTFFQSNGWLRNTTLADNYTRTVFMKDPATGINSNLKFTRDGADNWAPSDVMMLYTDKSTDPNTNDANCVVIGAWGHKIAAANAIAATKYKLLVNGRIKAKTEILVTDTGWADYVFAKDYTLKPLNEVANFIDKNGHLPNMPSAKEIETNGLPLANITTKQQEKIEELTLYAIEQDKKIKARQTQLDAQQKEVEALQTLVNSLIYSKN